MKRLSRFMFIVLIAALFPSAPSVAQGGGAFPQPSETLPGFKAHGVYETKGIENLSLFNGDPQLAVPLGPEYPLGFGASFRLTAHYSSRFWFMGQVPCGENDYGPVFEWRAHVRGLPTLGVGWTLELGSIDPAPPGSSERPRYLSPDGGSHEFVEPALGALEKPIRDGDFRIQRIPGSGYVVRFPDGMSHWLTHFYNRPDPRTGWGNGTDFSDVERELPARRTARWGLSEIRDRNGVTVARVQRDPISPWKVVSIWLPDASRKIDLHWRDLQLSDDAGKTFHWDVVSSIDFPVFSGASAPLTVLMGYSPTGQFSRWVESGTEGCVALGPPKLYVPMLTSITQGTEKYDFGYSLGSSGKGILTSFRLPTGALVEYGYEVGTGGLPCLFGTRDGCMSLDEGTTSMPEVETADLLDRLAAVQPYLDRSPFVISRTEWDPTNGNVPSTTTYNRKQFAQPLEGTPPNVRLRDPARLLRRVIVRRPSGNGGTQATRHVFHVTAEQIPGGTIWADAVTLGPGIEVERRTYQGATARGTPVRSVALCYDQVSFAPYSTHCGALAAEDTIAEFPEGAAGWRSSREVTWYGPNPNGGGECPDATAPEVACHYVSRSNWKPLALEFEQETVGAPKVGPSAVFLEGTLTGRRTTTVWNPQSATTDDPRSGKNFWLPKLYTSRTVADLYSDNACPSPPCSITTSPTFNDETGALESSQVSSSGYSRKVEFEYTGGNPTKETISGTGLSGVYITERAFQGGLVTTSRRILGEDDPGWNQFDVSRDEALGLVTVSRDPNGLPTTYSWDLQARLTRIRPPDEYATTICYTPWSSSTPTRGAVALVRRGGGEGCSTTGAVPAAGSETLEAYLYDGSGRLSREIRLLPNGLTDATPSIYLAVRTTERNEIGLVTAVSEWEPCGSGTDVSTCFTTNTTKKTRFWNFDVFGRARSILLPDGTQVVKGYDDWQNATSGIHIPATDTRVGTWTYKAGSTSAYEAVRKDILGRTIAIATPVTSQAPPAPPGAQATLGEITFYYNDIHDQVAKVTQERIAADGSYYTQVRTFTRNAFGFLTSEAQPETGTTTYGSFTALGHPKTVINGGLRRDRTYDALGRLTEEREGTSIYLRNRWDTDDTGALRGWSRGRLTTAIGENPFPSTGFDNSFYPRGTITDSYSYDGRGGRPSRKETTLSNGAASAVTSWTYNAFGLVEQERYPRLPHLAGQLVAETRYAAGAPVRITVDGQDVVKDVQYDPAGGMSRYTSGNDIKTTITPDSSGMPRPFQIKSSHPDFDTGEYAYDGFGNILKMGSDEFTYDASSRLLSARYGTTPQTYTYDGWNNLIARAGTQLPIDKATNRLTGATYDPHGNLTGLLGETYSYDGLGRQVRHDANGSHHSYLFDASSERIVKALPPSMDKTLPAALKRRDMARVILQVLGERPRTAYAAHFADVPSGDPEAGWIERFYDLAFTTGCAVAPRRYCPDSPLLRSEMAVFLSSALTRDRGAVPPSGTMPGVGSYDCRSGGSSLFADVAPDHWACSFIHYIFVHGVTVGCGENPRIFCPDERVSNWEMEAFVSRLKTGFGYVPPGATYTFRGEGGRVLTEFADSAVAKDYVYLGSRLVGTKDSGGWKYHATDHLGTVRLTTNALGAKVDSPKYWPWGEDFGSAGTFRFGLAGMERDSEISEAMKPRYYDHARSVSTGIGRFLSPDPLSGNVGDPLSWNRYAYARNNPLKYVDPTGMYVTDCTANDAACQGNAKSFEKARQAGLASEDAAVKAAASSYGNPGDANGVTVRFTDPGAGKNGVVSTGDAWWDSASGTMKGAIDVQIRPGLKGTELEATVGHEGQHVADAQGFLATFNLGVDPPQWDVSKNLTQFQTEMNAYRITNSIYTAANQNANGLGPGVYGAKLEAAILRILAGPMYRLSPAKPGVVQFQNWTMRP